SVIAAPDVNDRNRRFWFPPERGNRSAPGPTTVTESLRGNWEMKLIVRGVPKKTGSKVNVSSDGQPFARASPPRSEPGPLSLALVTTNAAGSTTRNVPSVAGGAARPVVSKT